MSGVLSCFRLPQPAPYYTKKFLALFSCKGDAVQTLTSRYTDGVTTSHLLIFLLWSFKRYANFQISTLEFSGTRNKFGNFSRIRELVIFSRICKILKTNYQLCHASPPVRLTVRPHGTTVLPLCTVSWNFIFNCFSTFCSEYPSSINIWQKHTALYMQTAVHLWPYLSGL
jgi:hypothetical protein